MVTARQIQKLVDDIVRDFAPQKVVLFGSYAYGKPEPTSDVDLLVLLTCPGRNLSKSVAIIHKLAPRFSVDIFVRTPEQFRERIDAGDFFLRDIASKGRILYEAAYAGNLSTQ